jgi:hypothetical protein
MTPAGSTASPFVDAESFEPSDGEAPRPSTTVYSPFVEAFALEENGTHGDSRDAARRVFLAELYDEELDQALYELAGEAAALVGASTGNRMGTAALELHFAPYVQEVEASIQRLADRFGSRELASIQESEIDAALSELRPARELSPAFENLFGGLGKIVKKAVSGAASLAKKGIEVAVSLGLGPFLKQVKKFILPMVKHVVRLAIERLPVAVQPAARLLAQKLSLGETSAHETEEPAFEVGEIQDEFNSRIADLLLRDPEVEPDHEAAPWIRDEIGPGIGDLDRAREQFVRELEQLEQGDDPGPAVENFLPALLPVLKLGIRIAGRKRVVSLLSGMVAKLISRFVGPGPSKGLSTALVDAGLKLMSLEVSEADQRRAAHAAVAATVEETIRRVAASPDAVLDDELLLEGSVVREFESAAAANFPPLLPGSVYRRRPELIETDRQRGVWVPFPLRGPKRYKKYSRIVKSRITPHVAMAIPIFGNVPLVTFLQEQLGLEPGEELEADVHLYEAMPGMLLPEVARLEGDGDGAVQSESEFHPLNQEAAGLLLGEPGLGRQPPDGGQAAARGVAVGQRFYRLAVPGRRVAVVPAPGQRRRARHRTGLQVTFDFPGDRIRLHLFLSERRTQELAASLRKQGHAGAVAARVGDLIVRGLAGAVDGNVSGRARIIHEALEPREARGRGLRRVAPALLRGFTGKVAEWGLAGLSTFFGSQAQRFITAAEDALDGVTVILTIPNPPGMAAIRRALAGTPGAAADHAAAAAAPAVQVDIVPGFRHG